VRKTKEKQKATKNVWPNERKFNDLYLNNQKQKENEKNKSNLNGWT
jgi:hypothetical protein